MATATLRCNVSGVSQAMCGVTTTLDKENKGCPTPIGSFARTSSPAAASAPLQALGERLLVHQFAARRVDENGPALHPRHRLPRDHADGFGRRRAMQRNDICARQQILKRHESRVGIGLGGARVVEKRGAKAFQDRRKPLGHRAIADKSDGAPRDFADAIELRRIGFPALAPRISGSK